MALPQLFIVALDALLGRVAAFRAMAADAAVMNGFCARRTDVAAAGCTGLPRSSFMMADGALADALRFVFIVIENDAFRGFVFSFCDSYGACREEDEGKKKNERKNNCNISFHIGK